MTPDQKPCGGLRPVKFWGGAMMLLAIAACGARPPDCTSKETTSLVQQVVKQEVQATALSAATRGVPQDVKPYWEKLVSRYVDGLKVEIGEIVSNGYDSGAKKYSCEGKISFSTATSDSAQVRSAFSSQATAKGDGEFLVTVDQAGAIARAVLGDFVSFARAEAVRENQKASTSASDTQSTAGVAQPSGTASAEPRESLSSAGASEQPKAEVRSGKKEREAEEARSGMPAEKAEYSMGINVVRFQRTGDESLRFEYVSEAPSGTCSEQGTATVTGSMASWYRKAAGRECEIKFYFSPGGRLNIGTAGQCIADCPPDQHALAGPYQKR